MRQERLIGRIMSVMCVGMVMAAAVQAQPATQPTTHPARPRGASGAASAYPRERIPFTNSRIANLNPELPTLFICGDSTAAQNANDIQRGWGAMLVDYFDTSKVNLVNFSQAGINFPSYYATRWPQVTEALKPGDFVVIELGHNSGHMNGMGDETREQASRRGGPPTIVHTYGWYIRTFIRDARAKGATPIVSTTTTRNMWSNPNATFRDSTILTQQPNYNPADDRVERAMGQPMDNSMWSWAHQVATEEKALMIDHNIIIADRYDKMGREAVAKLFIQDHTHTTTDGAQLNTETFLSGLRAQPTIKLNDFLNDKGKALDPYKPAGK